MKKNNDKFYTKPEIADDLIKFLLSKVDIDENDIIIEPSAGNGSFSNNSNLINYKIEAYDILPENKNVKKMNWFDYKPMKEDYIVIGNPPFGERSLLAIDFFNKASFANLIAFVLPVSFCKYSTQKMLDENFKLAFEIKLPQESFLDNGKDYSVRTVFQIWIKKNSKYDIFEKDYRKKTPPDKSHKDFKIWQYNATKQSENVIEEDYGITPMQIFQEIKENNKKRPHYVLRDALEAIKPLEAPRIKNTNEIDNEVTGKKIDNNTFVGNENPYLCLINGGKTEPILYNHKARYLNDINYKIYKLLDQGNDAADPKIKGIMPYENRLHCFKDKYYKLIADKPSRTITAHLRMDCHSHIHPFQVRAITPREAARCQSFPDDYMFLGAYLKTYMQIGNAVPCLMAKGIAETIKKYL